VPMYLPMSLFHLGTARPISTKFCTDLPANSGKVLNTSMTPPTQPLDPGVPQTSKPKWVRGEKTLCNISSANFSWAAPGPGWLVPHKAQVQCKKSCFYCLKEVIILLKQYLWQICIYILYRQRSQLAKRAEVGS